MNRTLLTATAVFAAASISVLGGTLCKGAAATGQGTSATASVLFAAGPAAAAPDDDDLGWG